ncbi:MAG: hypothetical protein JNN12_14725 [Bacteroidetes Order II. Incertae sedis bacterium]|nr:hypothetical protein [Bacteroidetes Order II. bacterium]
MAQNRPHHHRHRPNDRNRNRDRDKERTIAVSENPEASSPTQKPTLLPSSTAPAVLQSTASLEQLRINLQLAVLEMEKLRAENVTLSERIRTLGNEIPQSRLSLPALLEEESSFVKDRIELFVGALDAYVASESEIPPPPDVNGS